MSFRTVAIDAQTACRQMLGHYLAAKAPRFRLVAESALGAEALPLCRKHRAEVLVIDHCLPDVSSAETIACLRAEFPELRIMIFACHHPNGLARALAAGVHGCAMKSEPLKEFIHGLEVVVKGGTYFSTQTPAREMAAGLELTGRQREVLALIASGLSTKEVASRLEISFKTADHHRSRLMKKLKLHDLTSLVRFAIRTGLTEI